MAYIAIAGALALIGPGRISVDALGIRVPRVVAGAAIALVGAGVLAVVATREPEPREIAPSPPVREMAQLTGEPAA